MPLYQYQAFDQTGVLRKGSEDAVSESDLHQRLRSQKLYPKEIRVSLCEGFCTRQFEFVARFGSGIPPAFLALFAALIY